MGVDRELSANVRIGVGDNVIDSSDDLTRPGYEQRGWFLDNTGED